MAAAGAVVGVAGLAVSAVLAPGLPPESGQGYPAAAAAATPVAGDLPSPAPKGFRSAPLPPPTWIATLSAATPYSATPGGPTAGSVAAQNPFGATSVLAVVGDPSATGWLRVELPIRPNGSTGWIRSKGVALTQTSYRVLVNRETLRLTVMNAGRVVATTPVAVGKASTPTPAGNTFLWELIRPDNPYGAYGPYIFGLAWYSDAYSVFNGGDAQIGIHGQDEPWSIGHAVSHGCIRLPNDMITKLAGMLPLGTPVTIS